MMKKLSGVSHIKIQELANNGYMPNWDFELPLEDKHVNIASLLPEDKKKP